MSSKIEVGITRVIALEEHYSTPIIFKMNETNVDGEDEAKVLAGVLDSAVKRPSVRSLEELANKIFDLGERRIAEMDRAGIDVQVLSLSSPGTDQMKPADSEKFAREVNNYLAEAVKGFPHRFAAFATLPTPIPDKAADELERTVKEFGFKGAMINGHVRGHYLDDKFFWPIFERAESLNVPIYIHPTLPPKPVVDAYYSGNFPPGVSRLFSGFAWGWHIETATHILRLILGGVFDHYPKLQVIIGHLGEALPFMLDRLDASLLKEITKLDRPISAYLRENVYYTTSGFNYIPSFLDLLLHVGVDRIMFSCDYPYVTMEEGRAFLERLPISPSDKERIAHANAERLMRF